MLESIYKTPEGEAEIQALYAEALARLGRGYESLTVGTRLGDTHVLALGPEDAAPVVFLPGGNFLNPTCLKWFLPLAKRHRLYAPDIVGQPGRSAQIRPSPKGDGHAFWVEDVLEVLGLVRPSARRTLLRGGHSYQIMGLAPESVSQGSARLALGHSHRLDPADAPRGRSSHAPLPPPALEERLLRAAGSLLTEPEEPDFGPAVRQLGAVYRHLRLDAGLPRMATEEELKLRGAGGGVRLRGGRFFPAGAVLPRAGRSSPTSSWASSS